MSVRKDSLQANYIQKACFKHPEKPASHQLLGKGSMHDSFYCEKCSIMLASQGYNVIKLTTINNTPFAKKDSTSSKHSRSSSSRNCPLPSNRKNEISYFVQSLDSLNMEMIKKIELLQQHLIKSESQYGKMIEEANKFYSQIQEIIQLQKYTTYNSILNKRSIEEAKIRQIRQYIFEKKDEIEAILNDIRENMDAVETVDYSIYNAIMGGYQVKYENLKDVVKQSIALKPVQKYEIVFPQVPKFVLNLSQKISISVKKSIVSTVQSSINTSVKPQRIISEDDEAFVSEQSQYDEHSSIQRDCDSRQDFNKQGDQFLYDPKQIINGRGNLQQLAFSFDQNTNNEKQVIILDDCNIMGNGNSIHLRGFQGNFSKIEQRVNSKEVCESRQSLGEYLNISSSRQRHYAQDTETLLIA